MHLHSSRLFHLFILDIGLIIFIPGCKFDIESPRRILGIQRDFDINFLPLAHFFIGKNLDLVILKDIIAGLHRGLSAEAAINLPISPRSVSINF